MSRLTAFFIGSALTLGLAGSVHANEDALGALGSDEARSPLAVCGHLGEMEQARQALAEGDREIALKHLRAARAMLVQCEREAETLVGPRVEVGVDLI